MCIFNVFPLLLFLWTYELLLFLWIFAQSIESWITELDLAHTCIETQLDTGDLDTWSGPSASPLAGIGRLPKICYILPDRGSFGRLSLLASAEDPEKGLWEATELSWPAQRTGSLQRVRSQRNSHPRLPTDAWCA